VPVFLAAAVIVLPFLMLPRHGRGTASAVLIYVITLSPTLGIIKFGYMVHSPVADRFQYLASAAPIALAGAGLVILVRRGRPVVRGTVIVVCALIFVVLGLLTWRHAELYRDAHRIFSHTVKYNPGSRTAQGMLGVLAIRDERYDEAVEHLEAALRAKPNDAGLHYDLAVALVEKKLPDRALKHLDTALSLHPTHANSLALRGNLYLKRGEIELARRDTERALEVNPDYKLARRTMDEITSASAVRSPQPDAGQL
jgi:hypothetical protein